MSKKDPPAPPAAPDPTVVIGAQQEASTEAARLAAQMNRVNQVTPFGSRTYTNDGNDNWTQTDTIDPAIRDRLMSEVGLGTRVLQLAGDRLDSALASTANPFDMSAAPATRSLSFADLGPLDDGSQVRDRAFNLMLDRLAPEFAKDRSALDARLAAQGIGSGSEAYARENDDLTTAQNKSRIDAFLQSGAEADRIFGQSLAGRQQGVSEELALTGDARQKRIDYLAEQETTRGRPIAELAQLLSLAGGTPSNNFQGFSRESVAPADATAAYRMSQDAKNLAYQGELDQWRTGQQLIGNAIGSLPLFFI